MDHKTRCVRCNLDLTYDRQKKIGEILVECPQCKQRIPHFYCTECKTTSDGKQCKSCTIANVVKEVIVVKKSIADIAKDLHELSDNMKKLFDLVEFLPGQGTEYQKSKTDFEQTVGGNTKK